MAEPEALVWFRNDLRIADNPALSEAFRAAGRVRALYIHEMHPTLRERGGASRWWLHHSLSGLATDLAEIGVELEVEEGDPHAIILARARRDVTSGVFWNRRYGPAERAIDGLIKEDLRKRGIAAESFAANVLVEPFDMQTGAGKPYSVYTPFWKALKQRDIPAPLRRPPGHDRVRPTKGDSDYRQAAWGRKIGQYWEIGEQAARKKLDRFLDDLVERYPEDRDIPARDATSRLSPHLAFGEISPRQVWHAANAVGHHAPGKAGAIDKFLSELGWRDFNYQQLYHREDIAGVPMVEKYGRLEWREDRAGLQAWTSGTTGIPIVDAGMRELWETGTMHNRVRMLTASLLSKNLLIDWRKGEEWFWDTLVDADAANNPGNWQWVAGSGLDASPYFRIFNPVTQGEKFDPHGAYVRRWVPEVAKLPDDQVHKPWEGGGVRGYPPPLVELKATRERALAAFKSL